MEARVIFHRVGAEDLYHRTESVVHIQKRSTGQSVSPRSAARALEKSTPHPWPLQSRRDSAGLVYVMDNPTGGVWGGGVAKGVERAFANMKVAGSIPTLPHLHAEVSLARY
ncbi:unnamed protein product [Pleuronectes platessa]|uniref:Uncharacterized protein n=1 Tax=Pleuronectes platessa TaxID=8262 RepID=A0A9N7Z9A9_PLEPL|nr:unnamed protein product [Pleuronectes platessa]